MTPRDPLTAAAEEYALTKYYYGENFDAFMAGATWTLAHHPKVLKLVEALERVTELRTPDVSWDDEDCMSDLDWAEFRGMRIAYNAAHKIVLDALAAFRDGKGE
jgi:hypothetical protein